MALSFAHSEQIITQQNDRQAKSRLTILLFFIRPTIILHETPHRPQDRLRIQGIARLERKPQSSSAFPQCVIG